MRSVTLSPNIEGAVRSGDTGEPVILCPLRCDTTRLKDRSVIFSFCLFVGSSKLKDSDSLSKNLRSVLRHSSGSKGTLQVYLSLVFDSV